MTSDSQFPGPLISGNIGDQFLVCIFSHYPYMFLKFILLQINVIDQLTDPTMDRATSIV